MISILRLSLFDLVVFYSRPSLQSGLSRRAAVPRSRPARLPAGWLRAAGSQHALPGPAARLSRLPRAQSNERRADAGTHGGPWRHARRTWRYAGGPGWHAGSGRRPARTCEPKQYDVGRTDDATQSHDVTGTVRAGRQPRDDVTEWWRRHGDG